MADERDEDTQRTDMLEKIYEKLESICEQQQDIARRIAALEEQVELIRAAQTEHGKAIGAIQLTCSQRPFKCRARSSDTPPPKAAGAAG